MKVSKKSVRFVEEENSIKENETNSSDSDEAPDCGSLTLAREDFKNKLIIQKESIKEHTNKIKEKRKQRHEKNLLQKQLKKARQEEKNEMMIDPELVKNAQKMLADHGDESENDEGLFSGDEGFFPEHEPDAKIIKFKHDKAEDLLRKGGVHVVSLKKSRSSSLKSALRFKHKMLSCNGLRRISSSKLLLKLEKREFAKKLRPDAVPIKKVIV